MKPPVAAAPTNGRFSSFEMPKRAVVSVLGMGGELKSTVCLYANRQAVLSEPVGNLTDPRAYREYVHLIDEITERMGTKPQVIAHDLHPQYLSTQYAKKLGLPTIGVQHHHAHIVSVLAEQNVTSPAVGICCDGVGYGTDGAAWGCEIMACDASAFERLSHLQYFPLIGGDAAAVQTWRPAAAMMQQAYGADWRRQAPAVFERVPREDLDAAERIMSASRNAPLTSSLGRVFDGISFLLGLCDKNEREAQAAIALESAAASQSVEPYPHETTCCNGTSLISLSPMVRAVVHDLKAGRNLGTIAAQFHETMARMLAAAASMACEIAATTTVVLAGGCFANRRLTERLTSRLENRRLNVVRPARVSCGDAGLALGQAVAAAATYERAGGCV